VRLEALVKIGGDTYIMLRGKGKALEKIYKASGDTLRSGKALHPYRSRRKKAGLPPEALEASRAKGGGAEGNRTLDLLNAIQALSQLSYGPTRRRTEC
jgi:hypothetical protein